MRSKNAPCLNRPFRHLKALLESRQLRLSPSPETRAERHPPLTRQQEADLFARAMEGVTPLRHNHHWRPPPRRNSPSPPLDHDIQDGVAALDRLVRTGQGFRVAQTDEYMEAIAPGVNPRIAQRLHQGRYTIQDHIDLHGLFAREAEPVLRAFLRQSIARGCQAVLIIHGRGLKSPQKPVLKVKVFEWLTRGPLRSHVVALTSARTCDGGAGATYVLLRRRPLTRYRRKKPFDKKQLDRTQ